MDRWEAAVKHSEARRGARAITLELHETRRVALFIRAMRASYGEA